MYGPTFHQEGINQSIEKNGDDDDDDDVFFLLLITRNDV
jgi:hypothetical protein